MLMMTLTLLMKYMVVMAIILNGIRVASMLDDVHYRWFATIPKEIQKPFCIVFAKCKWQPCWMTFGKTGVQF